MQPDEFQLNDSDPKYAALNDTEISALIKASTVSPFTPSEKVKQAPINFQKRHLLNSRSFQKMRRYETNLPNNRLAMAYLN